MKYEIHDGPPKRARLAKYPFWELKVGQWFFVPCEWEDRRRVQQVLAQRGYVIRQRSGMKFTTTIQRHGDQFGILVERLT